MMMFSVPSDQFDFPRLFPLFQIISCHYGFFGFALINGILGCLQFLGTQLYFKDPSCAFQRCFWFPVLVQGSQLPGWQTISLSVFFSRHFLLFSNFPLLTRPPLWLLRSTVKSSISANNNCNFDTYAADIKCSCL